MTAEFRPLASARRITRSPLSCEFGERRRVSWSVACNTATTGRPRNAYDPQQREQKAPAQELASAVDYPRHLFRCHVTWSAYDCHALCERRR